MVDFNTNIKIHIGNLVVRIAELETENETLKAKIEKLEKQEK